MKAYTVEYLENGSYETAKSISILARNKEEAYEKAYYEEIPKVIGFCPYSAWVSSVTYQNGKYKRFDTYDGKRF